MADMALKTKGEVIPSENKNMTILLTKKPIGVVGGIIPWNAPIFILMRKVIPALVAGCSVVIKPSEETPLTTLKFAELTQEIELLPGLFQVVTGTGSEVGNSLAKHPKIALISLTGSTTAGVKVMESASQTVKRVNLELGGKAPVVVTKNANLDLAVEKIVTARIGNSGQVCTCPERLYVDESILDEFVNKLKERMNKIVVGDPLDPQTEMGAIINKQQLDSIGQAVDQAKNEGATIVQGGNILDKGKGFFFEPTIITNAKQEMDIMQKEIFGPVIPIMTYSDFDTAIDLANDSEYGLSSYAFTENHNEALRAVNEINFGEVYVNCEAIESINGYHAGWRLSGVGGADGERGYEEYLMTTVSYLQYGDE